MTQFFQHKLRLRSFPAGYHLITEEIEDAIPEIAQIKTGFLQVFIQHTSAALTINENADPTVRKDFQTFINDLIPESYPRFIHTYEGPDDMPAHIKPVFLMPAFKSPFLVENSIWEFGREFICVNSVETQGIEA